MNKHIKVLIYTIILLSIIFIPLLFILKFDNYKPCSAINYDGEEYVAITKDVYNKLENYKQVKLLQNKKSFKAYIEDGWFKQDNMYFAKVNSSYLFDNDDLKIYINSTNLFKF